MSLAAGVFHLSLWIGRRLYWEVSAEGIIEVPEVPADAQLLVSVDLHDHRLRAPPGQSSRQARQRFMREWGEAVRVVNRARTLGTVYGRDPARPLPRPASCRLCSGLQLIDRLVRRRGLDHAGQLIGLSLGASQGAGRRLVLLFAYDDAGELLRFQESANPPALDYLVEEFCRTLPAPFPRTPPLWFDQHDALQVLPDLVAYPDEDSWCEIPLRQWWLAGSRASLAATFAGLLWSAWAGWDWWSAQGELRHARAELGALQAEASAALLRHPRALARDASCDLAAAFRDAEQLWRPGTRVRILASPEAIDYTVRLAQLPGGDAPAASRAWTPHPLRATLDPDLSVLPVGVRALDPALGGDLRDYDLRFRRETPLPALAALAGPQP